MAFWAVLNIVVLFLVCMMSLQAPVRRGEERFSLDEPIWIFAANGALSTGRIKNISLSGAAIVADQSRALATRSGERARVFIAEVGFVAATVVRQAGQFLAVHFDLPPCVERDLLVRKLFTAGLDATTVNASALSSIGGDADEHLGHGHHAIPCRGRRTGAATGRHRKAARRKSLDCLAASCEAAWQHRGGAEDRSLRLDGPRQSRQDRG